MSDIRKRIGKKGTEYQVRHPSKATKSGYSFATFDTRKEALAFVESGKAQRRGGSRHSKIRTVAQAVDKWLDICEKEGCDGRDPVTTYTLKTYDYRAVQMKAYNWQKELHELEAPDIVEFRSWLLGAAKSRYQARKVLSSFHSVIREMALRGYLAGNVAAGISIRADSRYDEPVVIPTLNEMMKLLTAADDLANSKNKQTARTWERYRPMLYLAVDTGMRPQEYLVVPHFNVADKKVKVDRALESGDYKISVTKTPAGRRTIGLSAETYDMVSYYRDNKAIKNDHNLIFPTASGHWQSIANWRKRGFYAACIKAGLVEKVEEDGELVEKPKFKPYDLRHFYASKLIEDRKNLKLIQKLMGHEDIKTTLNVYGHLIEEAEEAEDEESGMIAGLSQNSCGESVADSL